MKFFRDLKTAAKLAIGFGVCLVLALTIGMLSTKRMATMNDSTKLIVDDALAGQELLVHLTGDMKEFRLLENEHLLENEQAGMDKIEEQMKTKAADIDRELGENVKDATIPEDKTNADELQKLWKAYLAGSDRQIALGRRNDDKAGFILMRERLKPFTEVTDKLNVIMAWNKKRGDQLAHDSEAAYLHARTLVVWLLVFAMGLGIFIAWSITRLIARPLADIATAAKGLSVGDIKQEVTLESKDEVGAVAEAFRSLIAYQKEMSSAAEAIASGDMTRSVEPKSDKDVLGNAFAKMVTNLSQLIANTRVAAESIATASGQVAAGNEDLSQRTEEQASSLEETASSMEEMTATVKQNADNARQANQLAAQASEVAVKGGSVVSTAVASMQEINKASKHIADIISVIDEIAFQTNLLALNASVEAARVGEQGKGFAVVAAEVRNLAGRSAAAAKEIKTLVQDSVQKVQEGSDLVNQSGQQLEEIVTSVKKVADIIAEISAASQEQSAGIEQVNKAIMQMDQITQQNAALVEEAASASASSSRQARELQETVAAFKLDQSFLLSIREQSMSAHRALEAAAHRQEEAAQRANGTTGAAPSGKKAGASKPSLASAKKSALHLVEADDNFEEF